MKCPYCERELEPVMVYNHMIMRCPNLAIRHPKVVYVPVLLQEVKK